MVGLRRGVLALCGVIGLACVSTVTAVDASSRRSGSAAAGTAPRLDYQFERASPAYFGDGYGMQEYGEDVPVYRTAVACSVSDGEIRPEPTGVAPHCRNSRYMFGRRSGSHIYRTQDGDTWEYLGQHTTRWMYALSDDTLIRVWPGGDGRETVSRSTDDGVTWQRARWGDTGEDFAWLTLDAWLMPFGIHQAANGTIVMVEYLLPEGGRYIYRSDDSGATWQVVYDAGEGIITHYHAVTKHEGLGRWVAATGDGLAHSKLIVSDDDGQTWYDYTAVGELYMQPTYLLDYGHPTRLLFGSDVWWQVGWVDVSDGPGAKKAGSLITNWNHAFGKALCWCIFEHGGLYYACSLDHTHTADRNVVISVTEDLEHWAIYHRFVQNEEGVLRFAGEVGGKLHLCISCAEEGYKELAISPATILTQQACVLAPPTENLFDSITTSSAESITGWINESQELPPGSGQKGLLEHVEYTAHHGDGCVHYWRSDGGYMRLALPPVAFEVGKTYQGRLRIKGRGAHAQVEWRRNGSNAGERALFTIWEEEWREVISAPCTVLEDTNDLRLRLTMWSASDSSCEAYVDSLQVEDTPGTHWHVGGAARASSSLTSVVELSSEWTNVFTIEPGLLSEQLACAGELFLRTYSMGPETYTELYFDSSDSRFKVRPTVNGFTYDPIATSPQHFQRQAHVRLAVRAGYDELSLSIANGQAIESVSSKTYQGQGPGSLTISSGGAVYGRSVLPCALFNDAIVDEYVPEEQLLAVMNDLGAGSRRQGEGSGGEMVRPRVAVGRSALPGDVRHDVTGESYDEEGFRTADHRTHRAVEFGAADGWATEAPRVRCEANELVKLTAADAARYDYSGCSISVGGDVAVIGAYGDDDAGDRSGAAYLYWFDGGMWVEEAKLDAGDGAAYDFFGASVSVSGDVAVIGAYGDDDAGDRSGAAYVYRFDGATWVEEGKLVADDGAAGDEFGKSVSVSGDLVVVGADGDDDTGEGSGSAYVYRYDSAAETWIQEAKLAAADAEGGDQFGTSVSVSGDTAVVGARFDDDAGERCGAAYVYRYDPEAESWNEEAKLTASDAGAGAAFGCSVSVSGDLVVIGAYGDDNGGESSGSAYVFYYTGGTWVEEAKLSASDGSACDCFGYSVAVSADLALIGAYGDDDAGENSGAAYLFEYSGGAWVEQAKLTTSNAAPYHYTGVSVSISGDRAVLGTYRDDEAGYGSGSAGVIAGLSDCNANGVIDVCDLAEGTSGDCNKNGVPDECDLGGGTSQDDNGNGIPDECEVLGDVNCDWSVNGLDIDAFVVALTTAPSFDGYYDVYPGCDPMFADCNEDGSVNALDIDPFVALLTGG